MMEATITVDARTVAQLLARLCRKAETPVAKAASKHEPALRKVFIDAVKRAQAAMNLDELEHALAMPGTGAALHVLQPVIDGLLEPTKLSAPHEPYVRRASGKNKTIQSVLSDAMKSGANAQEFCVIDASVGYAESLKESTNYYKDTFYFVKDDAQASLEEIKKHVADAVIKKSSRGFFISSPTAGTFGPKGWSK